LGCGKPLYGPAGGGGLKGIGACGPGGIWALRLRDRQSAVMPTLMAMIASTPSETPTPMAVFAPALRPEEEDAAVAINPLVGEVVLVDEDVPVEEEEEVEDDDALVEEVVEDDEEELEDDEEVMFGTILKPRLCNCPFTKPFPEPVAPLGSVMTRT
jgi:hypothetical protein